MNLLPKTHEEFSQVDYWNTFFKKRGKKHFEWYVLIVLVDKYKFLILIIIYFFHLGMENIQNYVVYF